MLASGTYVALRIPTSPCDAPRLPATLRATPCHPAPRPHIAPRLPAAPCALVRRLRLTALIRAMSPRPPSCRGRGAPHRFTAPCIVPRFVRLPAPAAFREAGRKAPCAVSRRWAAAPSISCCVLRIIAPSFPRLFVPSHLASRRPILRRPVPSCDIPRLPRPPRLDPWHLAPLCGFLHCFAQPRGAPRAPCAALRPSVPLGGGSRRPLLAIAPCPLPRPGLPCAEVGPALRSPMPPSISPYTTPRVAASPPTLFPLAFSHVF